MKYSDFCVLAIFFIMVACSGSGTSSSGQAVLLQKISGSTMGTSYHITSDYLMLHDLQGDIDQLLIDINHEVSTYEEDSFISLFNKEEKSIALRSAQTKKGYPHFEKNYEVARQIYLETNGFFDPTVMPLVNYWGFGPNKKNPEQVDSATITRIMQDVGFKKIDKKQQSEQEVLIKNRPGLQLDFSALAKGYAVDEVAELLSQAGSQNHLVEIGGEVRVKGNNLKSEYWTIGINKPSVDAALNSVYKKARLSDIALASSGNYRNYFKIEDKIYSHTMNPRTGYPERNEILSATILAPDCITADAYATACMTMGLEDAQKIVNAKEGVEAFFIYTDDNGQMNELVTKGASSYIVD